MLQGLKPRTYVKGLDKFKEYIDYVQKFSTMKTDRQFQKYIQDKFLETVKEISLRELPVGETSQLYMQNNKIRELDDGFVLYNDTTIETDSEGYGGQFSIALAFEYGTGIVGQNNPKVGAWQYNVNQHEKGWIYFKDGSFHFTKGLIGFEIYRFTKEEIIKRLPNWIKEYRKEAGGAS